MTLEEGNWSFPAPAENVTSREEFQSKQFNLKGFSTCTQRIQVIEQLNTAKREIWYFNHSILIPFII